MEIDLITLHLIFFFFLLIEKFFTFSSTLQFQKVFHMISNNHALDKPHWLRY